MNQTVCSGSTRDVSCKFLAVPGFIRSWKVMEFENAFSKPGKVVDLRENGRGHGKVIEFFLVQIFCAVWKLQAFSLSSSRNTPPKDWVFSTHGANSIRVISFSCHGQRTFFGFSPKYLFDLALNCVSKCIINNLTQYVKFVVQLDSVNFCSCG